MTVNERARPAALAAGARSGNLPHELTSFVGRRDDVAEVRRLLGAYRLVTLIGAGGIGKSRLALRVATDVQRTFADGAWLIELGESRDLDRFPAALAGALGINGISATSSLDDLAECLLSRRLLLLLDNCEQVVDEIGVAVESLLRRCAHLRILATSRESLGIGGGVTFPVRPLALPDATRPCSVKRAPSYEAVTLFADRARAAVPEFGLTDDNTAVVARICQLLEGLPLPIELAAARLRAMSAPQVLHQLSDRYRLLTMGTRGAPTRQRSLRGCIEWSHNLCTPLEQQLWARLSVFAGGFELDAAADVCTADLPPNELLDMVTGLIDKSILLTEETGGVVRYRFLETLRTYGTERLRENGDYDEFKRRHRDWYTQLAMDADADWVSPRQLQWINRLAREQPNFRDAMTYSLSEPGDAPHSLRIAYALRRFWSCRGLLGEGGRWLAQSCPAHPEHPTPLQITALCARVWLTALEDGESVDSETLMTNARQGAVRLEDPHVDQAVAEAEGELALLRADTDLAVSSFEKALAASREAGDLGHQIEALLGLGRAYGACDDTDRAIACHTETLAITEALGESSYRAQALATFASRIGSSDPPRALGLLERSLRLSRCLHSPLTVASCLDTLAQIATNDRTPQRAAVFLAAGDEIRRVAGVRAPKNPRWDHLRRVLSEKALSNAVQHGRGLNLGEAVAYALDEGDLPRTRTKIGLDGDLTPREQQVAHLVAQGLTNRAIAGKLTISERTAQGHVEHVLIKLGFTSRVQIASWVAEHTSATLSS